MKRSVKADPKKWSEKSKQSDASYYTYEYTDIKYFCRRCGKPDIFSANDQKESYEVKKKYFWQRRILCQNCWNESNAIRKEIRTYQSRWADEKTTLKNDVEFLSRWLELLVNLEEYIPFKPDLAKKNMLTKLIKQHV